MTLLPLLLLPLLVAGVMFVVFKTTITWKEFLLQAGVSVAVIVIGYFIAKHQSISSVEHLNGRITEKVKDTRSCCHCTTVCTSTDKDGNCTGTTEVCDHIIDYEWYLKTTVGNIGIEDCKHSSDDPPVWAAAYVGEPASIESRYTNYLKADKHSLVVHKTEKWQAQIPDYPNVFNYYKVNPVISYGVPIPKGWQEDVREINSDLGASRQVDVAILLTRVSDPTYSQAVESKWLYGPKNSLTVVLGVDEDYTVRWARVVTISKVESLKIHLRNELKGKNIIGNEVPTIIRSVVSNEFIRTPMAEFEYLASNAEPSTGWLIGLYIFGVAVSIGLGVWMHKEDVF